jgi:hypothetical protein
MSSSAAAPSLGHAPITDLVELELDRAAIGDGARPLLLRTCPRCAGAPATRLERMRLRAIPSWLLLASVALYTLTVAFAVRATDFVWYHSLLPRPLYEWLLNNALVATLLVPPAFVLAALVVRLLRPRLRLRVSTCAACSQRLSRSTWGRVASVALLAGAWAVTAFFADAMGVSIDLAIVLYVPVTAIGVLWFSHLIDRDRIRFVRVKEGGAVLLVPRVFARVLADERPTLVRSVAARPGRRAALPGVLVLATALLALVAVDEATLVCPPNTTGHVSILAEDDSEHHWCVLPDGVPHGRYQAFDRRGSLRVVGGYDRGHESGTWAHIYGAGGAGDVVLQSALEVTRPWSLDDGKPFPVSRPRAR